MQKLAIRTPWQVAGITALFYALFVGVRLAANDFDASHFVCAGDRFCDESGAPDNLSIAAHSDGYDGEFFYRLALDPWPRHPTAHGIRLDLPAYRHQRIIYPLLAWALSLGKPGLIPWSLILVNFLAVVLLGYIASLYVRDIGRRPVWGLAITLYPGFVLTVARDLSEVVASCGLLSGFFLYGRSRNGVAAAALTLAVLARETTLIAVAAIAIAGLIGRFRHRAPLRWQAWLPPMMAFFTWQIVLRLHWGRFPFEEGSGNFTFPFAGPAQLIRESLSFESASHGLWLAEAAVIAFFAVAVIHALRTSKARAYEIIAWILYALLACGLSHYVWNDDWNFLRVLSEFYLFGAIILLHSRGRLCYAAFAFTGALWVFLAFLRTDLHRILLSPSLPS